MTESEDDYGDHEHDHYETRRRNKISSSMQRSIDRLLGCTVDPSSGKRKSSGEDDAIIDENGKITFDRRLFDFDTYHSIIDKVTSFDYKEIKLAAGDVKKVEESFNDVSEALI